MKSLDSIYKSGKLSGMKKFWSAYIIYYHRHKKAMWVNIAYCLCAGLGMGLITRKFPYLFFLGYMIGDPVSYYVYRFRQLTADEREAVDCDHELLLIRDDGTPITGSGRCKFCGLNQSYW